MLANIRKKQARSDQRQRLQRQASAAKRDPVLSRLAPLSELLYSHFHKIRRSCNELRELVSIIVGAGTAVTSAEEAQKQLEALARCVPEWCTISLSIDGKRKLVRLNNAADYRAVRCKLVRNAEG